MTSQEPYDAAEPVAVNTDIQRLQEAHEHQVLVAMTAARLGMAGSLTPPRTRLSRPGSLKARRRQLASKVGAAGVRSAAGLSQGR